MDIKINESIAFLKACIDTNRTNDASQHIENIEHNFEGNLTNSEIGTYVTASPVGYCNKL